MIDNFDDIKSSLSGYFVEIDILDIGIKRDFPILSRKNKQGVREYRNDIRGKGIYIDNITLEDLIKFQNIKYKIVRGYYYTDGFNTGIKLFIRDLFEERLIKKKAKNPIESVYKLLMNSLYGKLIMKPINNKQTFIYGNKEKEKFLSFNFNTIKEYTEISHGMTLFKQIKS